VVDTNLTLLNLGLRPGIGNSTWVLLIFCCFLINFVTHIVMFTNNRNCVSCCIGPFWRLFR